MNLIKREEEDYWVYHFIYFDINKYLIKKNLQTPFSVLCGVFFYLADYCDWWWVSFSRERQKFDLLIDNSTLQLFLRWIQELGNSYDISQLGIDWSWGLFAKVESNDKHHQEKDEENRGQSQIDRVIHKYSQEECQQGQR